MKYDYLDWKKNGKYCIRITENIEVKTNDIKIKLLNWLDRRESDRWNINEHFNNYELFKRNLISSENFNKNFKTIDEDNKKW